jgi:RNA-directed DNA polymerase
VGKAVMKRIGYLFEKMCDFHHLFNAYQKALKGSGNTGQGLAFHFHAEKEILTLQRELLTGQYHPRPYTTFKICDPKERIISVAPFRDRVVHHAVVGVLEDLYEKCFIFDSYATRKNKGTHKAIDRAQIFLRNNRFYLKSDIAKYFYSIDHNILLDLIQRKTKDQEFIKVVEKIIRNGNQGLPIGNLTSQFFANVYLNPLDHFVKETLRARCYVRYMDDFVVFSDAMPSLQNWLGQIAGFLRQHLKLELKSRGTCINTRAHGLSFLGFRIFPSIKRIKQPNLKRISRNIRNIRSDFNRGKMSEAAYASRMTAVFNHLSFADSFRLRCDMVAAGKEKG